MQSMQIFCYSNIVSSVMLKPKVNDLNYAKQVGVMEDDYTCLGLLCAILFFPLGLICCLLLKTRRCSNCGAYFD